MRGLTMRDSRTDTTGPDEGADDATVARVTLAVGNLRVSTETRDSAAPHLRLDRSPTGRLGEGLGGRLPRSP
ncbi:hypothetical protein [Rhodoplanes roseus]|nr:hypothetical protein [Rhodoplanes roseus]